MISLTFDDALLNTYDVAFPLMEKYGFTGVVFVPTGIITGDVKTVRLDDAPYMRLDDLRQLHNAGWEIGSHTVTHRRLDSLSLATVEQEYAESKKRLENWGFDPVSLAYPYGFQHYTREMSGLATKYYYWMRDVGDEYKVNHIPYPREHLHGIPILEGSLVPRDEGWYIFVMHCIQRKDLFDAWLRRLAAANVRVVTLKEMV